MNVFTEKAVVFKNVIDNFDAIVFDVIVKQENYILDLVRDEQLYQGLKADGSQIRPAYTPTTKAIKRAKGQPTDRVTWRDTGKLYKSLQLKTGMNEFEIEALDSKIGKLTRKYGNDVLGLTDDSIAEITNFIRPLVINELLEKLEING